MALSEQTNHNIHNYKMLASVMKVQASFSWARKYTSDSENLLQGFLELSFLNKAPLAEIQTQQCSTRQRIKATSRSLTNAR